MVDFDHLELPSDKSTGDIFRDMPNTDKASRTDDIFGGLMTVLERSLAPLLSTSFGLQVLAKMVLLVPVLLGLGQGYPMDAFALGPITVQCETSWFAENFTLYTRDSYCKLINYSYFRSLHATVFSENVSI